MDTFEEKCPFCGSENICDTWQESTEPEMETIEVITKYHCDDCGKSFKTHEYYVYTGETFIDDVEKEQ